MKPRHPEPQISAGVRLLVDELGLVRAARKLGFAEATTARLAGGLTVSAGTEALAEKRLRELKEAA
jgi:hypothetical protein